jgi:protein tyrosine/serine phosphatase
MKQQLPEDTNLLWHHSSAQMMIFAPESRLIRHVLTAALALIASSASFAQKIDGVSDPPKELSVPSLPNSAKVTANLYRGAQPGPSGYAQLKNLGIEIVVDLRQEKPEIKDEQARVEASGMRFVSIPWSPLNNPSRAQIISFFDLLKDNPQKKIFVHCEEGADRTGTMIALYRVGLDGWTPQQAVAEMNLFHFHSVLYPHLARLVQEFPAAIAADPALLAGFAPKMAALREP